VKAYAGILQSIRCWETYFVLGKDV